VIWFVLLAMAAASVLMLLVARRAPISHVDDVLSRVDHELETGRYAQPTAADAR